MFKFLQEYFPHSHSEDRMKSEGDVVEARRRYREQPLTNLKFLLEKRMTWMNQFIPATADTVIEVGCGMGVTKDFVTSPQLVLTDFAEHPWVEKKVDALNMPFAENSVDVFIANNMIHHLAYPAKFLQDVARMLKPGGRILIQEINASIVMRCLLRALHHEGYSMLQDPFDTSKPCNDPRDLWSANCAVPYLLFEDPARFEREFPDFKIEYQRPSEFFIFPLSGGVIAQSPTIPLPRFILKLVDRVDEVLVNAAPGIFALQRKVVLKKKG